jgi:hypothetical protein
MFSKWSVKRKLAAALLVLVGLFAGLLAVLTVDGTLYERWKDATHLRSLYRSWVLDGSPHPIPEPQKYGYSSAGTAYVYAASQVIDGQTYRGLFAYREYTQPTVFAITTNGVCLVDSQDKRCSMVTVNKPDGANRSGRSQSGCWLARLSSLVILGPVAHLKRSA